MNNLSMYRVDTHTHTHTQEYIYTALFYYITKCSIQRMIRVFKVCVSIVYTISMVCTFKRVTVFPCICIWVCVYKCTLVHDLERE